MKTENKNEERDRKQKNIDSELENSEVKENGEENKRREHGEILNEQLEEGKAVFGNSPGSIALCSFTAGLEIGFSFLLMCSVFSFFTGKLAEDTIFKLLTFVYPAGFIFVILGRSLLFTEQTSLLSLPVLNRKQSVTSLLKLWSLVIFGNLAGGCLMAALLIWIGPALGLFDLLAVEKIASHVISFSPQVILISAILAGWLMGLLSWLLASATDTVSRILLIIIITGIMAFTSLHHSIVGNVEVFAGLLSSPKITISDYLIFESVALLGNAIGGVVFVALLKYRAFVYNVD
ncbi:formate/nitrite transporter FocA (FNT family) [Gillisia mitskevichiae]|uniref:Formate/nitrite transporter FocA (FNT family) n=1 Tax=Gillisia mitskevichiae TaxID=270921 RepID=A0A495PR28_9FLAO|nr:formate/nitrite transporter family protein [Gillisia mitskevichiae]RKS53094.1 formate/nitrite transporter FocA (FNT family) [Gillisia mitskevichiae]